MNFKQFLAEWSHTAVSIFTHMNKLGYKKLGSGVDQTAYLEPETGKVLKIFGTHTSPKSRGNISPAQKMFAHWADYCKKNKSNPFLPRFDGWEHFDWKGDRYLQIRMEKLQVLPMSLGMALYGLSSCISNSRNHKTAIKNIIDNVGHLNDIAEFEDDMIKNERDEIDKLAVLLGEKNFTLLLNTISELSKIAGDFGYDFDLHNQNFMHRNDGIPVIVDPWTV